MGLEQYLVNFVAFVNNIGIPFLLGIAFLIFVTNAVRFFIVGGANMESKEKARSLAIYGVLAFVLIMTFWGITVLLASSLGLNQFATSDNTCFDYDPLCNDGINYNASGPGSRPSIIGRAGAPTSQGPTSRPIVTNNNNNVTSPSGPSTRAVIIGNAGKPQDSGPRTRPVITNSPGRVAEAIEDFANTFNPTEYGSRLNTVIKESVDALADPSASTEDRAKAAVLLEKNGYIDETQLGSYIGTLNTERAATGQNLQPLDMIAIRSEADRPPDALTDEIRQTQSSLLSTLAEGSRRWYDIWGAPDRAAQADALALVREIYNEPADPDRIATFDILLSGNEDMNQAEIAAARSRMIEEMNAERFYAGFGPLSDAVTEETSIGSTGGNNQQTQAGTNNVDFPIAAAAERSVNNVIPDVQNNLLTSQIRSVSNDNTTPAVQRLEKAKAFEAAGFITPGEYQAVVNSLNTELTQNGQEPLSREVVADIAADDNYVETIVKYRNDVETSKQIITDFYGGDEAAADQVNQIFNTEYSLEERREAADEVYKEIQAQTETNTPTGSGNVSADSADKSLNRLKESMYSALGTEAQLSDGQ